MPDLKDKLASQLNKAESLSGMNNMANDNCDLVQVKTDASIITLDAPIDVNSFQVVPEFAITFSEAKQRLAMFQTFVKELNDTRSRFWPNPWLP